MRAASEADAAALAGLAAVTFPAACPAHTTDAAKAAFIRDFLSEARFRKYLADASRHILVSESPSTNGDPTNPVPETPRLIGFSGLIGFAMLVAQEPQDADVAAAVSIRPTIEVSKFYVLADHRGAGVAAELMAGTLDAAAARATGVWLGVNNENARAIAFYRKHGFEVVGTKRFLVGDRLEHDFVMERALRDPRD